MKNSMDYRRLTGMSIDEIKDEIDEDNNDENYGTVEKTSEVHIKLDINRKKAFKHSK